MTSTIFLSCFLDPVTGAETRNRISTGGPASESLLSMPTPGSGLQLTAGRYGKTLMRHLDGKRTLREIFGKVRSEPEFKDAAPRIRCCSRNSRRYLRRLTKSSACC